MKSLLILSLPLAALAQSGDGISLGGPAVIKLDWNTRALQAVDMNGDGRKDIVVANADRSAIEILYQLKPDEPLPFKSESSNRWQPVIEDAPFKKASVTTSTLVYDLVAGDINGDGRPDLVYSGDPEHLTLRLAQKDGTWTEERIPEAPSPQQGVGSIRLADLDGDGKTDLAMLGQKELAVYRNLSKGSLATPERYTLPDDTCYGLEVVDVDADGLLDLLYLCGNSRDPVRVRRQTAAHQFGAESAYTIKPTRCTLQILRGATPKDRPTFAFAQDVTGHLEEFRLVDAKHSNISGLALRPRIFSPRGSLKTPSGYAVGDVDNDGQTDVVVSDPDGAQAYIYLRQKEGGFTLPRVFPVLADARTLAVLDWDGDGKSEVFFASPKEQVIGLSRWEDTRLEYPQPLGGTGKPFALAATAHLREGQRGALAVAREEAGKRYVELWRAGETAPEKVTRIELVGLRADPKQVRWVDANQDGLMDVAVFSAFDAMRLVVQGEDGKWTDVSTSPGYRKGLVDNLDAASFSTGDVDNDGLKEMLVATGAFCRALKLGENGELIVVDQFNAKDSTSDVSAVFAVGEGAHRPMVLYDRKGEQFQVLKTNDQGLYQVMETIPAGRIDVVGSWLGEGTGAPTEAFVFGKDRFWWLPFNQTDFQASTVSTYATDLPDISYADVLQGDITGDGIPEMICNDPGKNMLEILSRGEGGRWTSRMHFKVFEVDEHYQGRRGGPYEPRETILADVTGDKRNDLILLVHDRILVYPQE